MIDPKDIADAVTALRADKLVIMPTETVYGLAASALSDDAVARIYAAKSRPQFNPLIIHVPTLEDAERYGWFNTTARTLALKFWPGALTLVVPKAPNCAVSGLATAGLNTLALRIPAHPVAQTLLRAAKLPLAAPSANKSGKLSPTDASHLENLDYTNIDVVLDAGPTTVGIESTIVSCVGQDVVLLRSGGISRDILERSIDSEISMPSPDTEQNPSAPGQLASHYAPSARIRLNVTEAAPNEGLLAFGMKTPVHAGPVRNLSTTGDLTEAAANLFRYLHELDAAADRIAVMKIPQTGLGEAINDRLNRAAAPRS